MKVYFYHTQDLNYIQKEWEKGNFPSHLLYGALELKNEGIEVVMHKHVKYYFCNFLKMLDVLFKVLSSGRQYDAIYATKYNGLELVILLHSLGIFKKPIIIWRHQPISQNYNRFRRILIKFFLKGIDYMFFFSDRIIQETLKTKLLNQNILQQCPWGTDLNFYTNLMNTHPIEHTGFISTGKEKRDIRTLISAFSHCEDQKLKLILPNECCGVDYENILSNTSLPKNIDIFINETMWIPELSLEVWKAKCVCICCEETNYTVGLTTLIEALALGLPIIITKNPNLPFDVSVEGCGISVEYGDVKGWIDAIQYISNNPEKSLEMGKKSRKLAEKIYNIDNCAHIVANRIKSLVSKK